MKKDDIEALIQFIEEAQEAILDKLDLAEELGQYSRAERLLEDYRHNEEQIMKLAAQKRALA